jgi:Alpha/beta hydrolase of unknown function (DUF900)
MHYLLWLRDPTRNRGGPVLPATLEPLTRGARATPSDLVLLSRRCEGCKVVFLVHGYNVSRDDGRRALTAFISRLPYLQDAVVFAVLWPGDSYADFLSYSFEGDDADDSARELVKFIGDHLPASARLGFVSHSLGARVVMATIRGLAPAGRTGNIEQVCLMAAAIDNDSLTDADRRAYLDATRATKRVAVLSSIKDSVLRFAYPAGDLLQVVFFSDTDGPGWALGYTGPSPYPHPDRLLAARIYHEPIPAARNVGHSHYLPGPRPTAQEDANQHSAARFADAVLRGDAAPVYR